MRHLLHILFWSIIAAAFIGPGTVTTAAASGAQFSYSLLWALLFSTFACLVLQEASARVTVISGKDLGQAIRERFRGGAVGFLVLLLVLGAIVLGCAAYEAGNILGGVAGAALGTGFPPRILTLAVGLIAGLLLYFGTTKIVARILGVVVAFMGVAFLVTACLIRPPLGALLRGTFLPAPPVGSGILVLGLIGTTVVPYNLFLGSGIAAGQKLGELRFGLTIAILLGGLISMGILVVGTVITGPFSFEALSSALSERLGGWAGTFFALGLFAAGFSSAITAPLAAAVTARGLFGTGEDNRWHERSYRYRCVWLVVLATGVVFGLTGVRPIPAIILAQALNGILLPFVAIFLLLVVNDRALMGSEGINHVVSNICMGVVVAVTIVLGVSKTVQAVANALKLPVPQQGVLLVASAAVAVILAVPITRNALNRRH
ncbi:MAG: divalent metal cation transporter [bacterium]|nr:MAG: divalent metal cation transporter [bacterium]